MLDLDDDVLDLDDDVLDLRHLPAGSLAASACSARTIPTTSLRDLGSIEPGIQTKAPVYIWKTPGVQI